MPCNRVLVVAAGAILWLITATSIWATPSGSAEEARALLDKAIAAVRADKLKALEMFNSGAGGFKDRDLYVSCANASDGIVTAHPTGKGAQLRDLKDERGYAFGEEIMRTATEGKVSKITYLWPRPGSDKPVEKTSFFTKVGDQICGVGPGLACAVRKSRRYCLCICGVGPIREAPRQSLLVA